MVVPLKFISHTIEDYAISVTYNPTTDTGKVVYNLSLIGEADYEEAMAVIRDACRAGISVSSKVGVYHPGKGWRFQVPEGQVAIINCMQLNT